MAAADTMPASSAVESVGDVTLNGSHQQHSPRPLDDVELLSALRTQLDFYFSKENLATDAFLVSNMNADRCVSIDVIIEFKRVQQLTQDREVLLEASKQCKNCEPDRTEQFLRATPKAERTTLILRDLPTTLAESDIRSVLDGSESPAAGHIVSIKPSLNDTWYVVLDTEAATTATAEWCNFDGPTVNDIPLKARVKSETVFRGVYANSMPSASPKGQNGMMNGFNGMHEQPYVDTSLPAYQQNGEYMSPNQYNSQPFTPDQSYNAEQYSAENGFQMQPQYSPQHANGMANGTGIYPTKNGVYAKKGVNGISPMNRKPRKLASEHYTHANNNYSDITSDSGSVASTYIKKKGGLAPVRARQILQRGSDASSGDAIPLDSASAFPALPTPGSQMNGHQQNGTKSPASSVSSITHHISASRINGDLNGYESTQRERSDSDASVADSVHEPSTSALIERKQSETFDFAKANTIFGKLTEASNGHSEWANGSNDTPLTAASIVKTAAAIVKAAANKQLAESKAQQQQPTPAPTPTNAKAPAAVEKPVESKPAAAPTSESVAPAAPTSQETSSEPAQQQQPAKSPAAASAYANKLNFAAALSALSPEEAASRAKQIEDARRAKLEEKVRAQREKEAAERRERGEPQETPAEEKQAAGHRTTPSSPSGKRVESRDRKGQQQPRRSPANYQRKQSDRQVNGHRKKSSDNADSLASPTSASAPVTPSWSQLVKKMSDQPLPPTTNENGSSKAPASQTAGDVNTTRRSPRIATSFDRRERSPQEEADYQRKLNELFVARDSGVNADTARSWRRGD